VIVQIVRFKSGLSDDDVVRTCEARAPRYRELPGLVQKYYLRFPTGEYGAVYVWDSEEALADFRESELGRTISTAYRVEGEADVEVANVFMRLREDQEAVRP
jgi:heme-degrading monooxygenase HmoA